MRAEIKSIHCPFCALCGGKTDCVFREQCLGGFVKQIFRCRKCGLGFVSPSPSREVLTGFYNNAEYFVDLESDGESYRPKFDFPLWVAEEIFRTIKIRSGVTPLLLDIGSGIGTFLQEVKRIQPGIDAVGLEPSTWAVEHSRRKGLNVMKGFFEDAESEFQDESFAVVCAFELIEHLLNPFLFIRQVKRILEPNGYFIFSTPDFNSLIYKIRAPHALGLHREHLFYFTKGNLIKMLSRDFTILKIGEISGYIGTGILSERRGSERRTRSFRRVREVTRSLLKTQPFVRGFYQRVSSLIGISSLFVIAQKK